MSKKNVDLAVVFSDDGKAVKAATVVLQGLDLYTMTHHPELPIESKHSYHASGVTHTKTNILDVRLKSRGRVRRPLKEVKGFEFIDAGGGPPPPLGDYVVKADTPRRKTIVMPLPDSVWGTEVWVIETGRGDLAKRIAATAPYDGVRLESILADWSSPFVLLRVWCAVGRAPYDVIKYQPAIRGRVPYIFDPPAYRGTWLEPHFPPRPEFENRLVERFRRDQQRGAAGNAPSSA